ncbi:efflux RND transporter permease subunit [Acaricomes phytoseiuli]|uniref:efflux RND transporter permease subunit n=1 Tax=Acaricomes phytoseiuli TaxID=291968 RepID=UPI000369273B|nr:efflux RND transporter permease subunit [Acaricomes phytoseiuli]
MFRLAVLSLGNRALIALITVFAAVFGVIAMGSLKQELIPSIEFPQVTVVTSMPGDSPEVIDAQVSRPLESALNAVENLQSSTATSRSGISTINLTFAYGTNLDRARNQVDRAIANVRRQLPDAAEPRSVIGSVSDLPIRYIAVSSDQSLSELGDQLQRVAVPQLLKLEGVRGVEVTGTNGQHLQITPDPAKLAAAGVGVTAISDALKNNGNLVSAGSITTEDSSLSVQVGSPITSLDAVRDLPLSGSRPEGAPATIGSVAEVSLQDDAVTSITRTNGQPTLALSITKKPEADTVAVSHAVTEALPGISDSIVSGVQFTSVFDQASFIERSINDLGTEGLLGLGFAVLVILLFLLSVRSTLVTAVSIPLSLLITLIGLWATNYSLNIMTLGALTIAIGRVVDDSIVVIENIKRHQSYGEDKLTAITSAIWEVAGAVTASTLTTVAVFAPIAFLGELAGELFRPFALTVSIALLASLLVSLTIVPVLAYWFLHSPQNGSAPAAGDRARILAEAERKERQGWLQRGYLPVLQQTQRRPVLTLSVGAVILIGTIVVIPLLPQNLLGDSGENSMSITQTLPPGTSLQATSDAAEQVEQVLQDIDGIQDVQVTVGNASGSIGSLVSAGASSSSFQIVTDEKQNQPQLQSRVRSALEEIQGAGTLQLRASGYGLGTLSTADVRVWASNMEDLQQANDTVLSALQDLPEARDVVSNLAAATPVVQVTIDRAKVVAAGLNEQQVAGALAATVSPVPAGTVRLNASDYTVQIGEGTRFDSVAALAAAEIPAGSQSVPLSSVATVEQVQVPSSITSSNGQRTARVSLTPTGDDLSGLSAGVERRLEGLQLPAGASTELGGVATHQRTSFNQLGLALLAAIAIVYIIMVATFKSLIQPLILLVSIPFAATGAVGLLLLTGVPLGLPSLIGMLMLVGIVVTNAIVLIDLINQARRPRPGPDGKRMLPSLSVAEAIEYGARHRLRPILMTALATICALIPMALGITGGGGFISQPLAIVVIGGLISSTVLTLILVPVLYRLVEGGRERRALLKQLQQVPEPAGAPAGSARNADDFASRDWTTGAVPKVRGRRSSH